jgi:hypothetical protein
MERLIQENKLWEQLHSSFIRCFDQHVPFHDKLGIVMAFLDIFDVVFDVLKESPNIDWQSPELRLLFGHYLKLNVRFCQASSSGRSSISVYIFSVFNFVMLCCLNSLCDAAAESLS